MTLNEAMEIITNTFETTTEEQEEAMTFVRVLFEKRKRKKPLFICPSCEKEISTEENFCHFCGQAIDWSVEE